jgi:thiol-disulfide isomerase/thioredoxin
MVKTTNAALLSLAMLIPSLALAGDLVLLDFASPTCGPCHQMISTIESLQAAGYPIRRVDVTREPELAQRFSVTQVPCFVMLADGQETGRIVGATSRQQLERMFQDASGRIRAQSPDAMPPADPWSGAGSAGVEPSAKSEGATYPTRPNSLSAAAVPRVESKDEFSSELISSSVRLRVDDASGHSYGTGTIIDARSGEALIITCGHLFRDSKGKGPILVELFAATPQGVRVVGKVPGQVIDYTLDRDIGWVSIRPDGPVRAAPVAPTQTVVDRGDRVTSVGCDHGKDPTALATRVTNVDRYQGPPNIEAGGAPVEGRSGGGLFNSTGQLIGVCFAADYEGNEGLYTAIESIHDELDRLGLSDIYRATKTGTSPADQIALQSMPAPTATPPVVRGQEPLEPVMPLADRAAGSPSPFAAGEAIDSAAAPSNLNRVEQAAWEEIVARAADAEVICIIRPREPGGKSEVITLDRVSPEFVRALAGRGTAGAATITR